MKATKKCRRRRFNWVKWFRRELVVMITLCFFFANAALANPLGGQVISGNVQFKTQGNTLTITNSPSSIINWQSFSINSNETTRFIQQNSASSILNRIYGQDPSTILGALQSNGRVLLINPNGIIFGQGSRVDVNGFIASTLNLSNQDFLSGKYNFTAGINPGNIQNQGTITTPSGGMVYLIAPNIENNGIINSPHGDVLLAAGHSVQLVDSLNPEIAIVVSAPADSALNLGQIIAQSGRVGIYGGLISQKGIINADSAVAGENGKIFFKATQDIMLDAGSQTSAQGGKIQILGGMEDGTVKVAGIIDASAPNGGDGGFIETSAAHVIIEEGARVTTLAPYGKTGTWLIDPVDFTIAASGGDMTGTALSANLNSNNVTILSSNGTTGTNGDVNVNDAVSWSANNKLTLTASNNVNVNANITATGNTAGLVINPNTANGSDSASGTGIYSLNNSAVITLSGLTPSLSIAGNTYTVINQANADVLLQNMNGNLSGFYALVTNIDASSTATWNPNGSGGYYGFAPVGQSGVPFTGTFDGLGHIIAGLYINSPTTSYVGLFGYNAGVIRNVGLTGVNISVSGGTNSDIGGLVGWNDSSGVITNSYSTGFISVTGENLSSNGSYIGGLVGQNQGSIKNSYTSVAVGTTDNSSPSGDSIGGLVGENGGSITNSYSTGPVSAVSTNSSNIFTGGETIGGLVGGNDSNGVITNSYSTGTVNTTNRGGLNQLWGGHDSIGGLLGYNVGNIYNSYSAGAVSITNSVGSYGGASVGGLIGYNEGNIYNSYSTGSVSVANGSSVASYDGCCSGGYYGDHIGGLVGWNWPYSSGIISNSYSTGSVSTSGSAVGDNIGGLVGLYMDGTYYGGTVSNSYWDMQTSGQPSSVVGTGLTTTQMMTQSSFSGWDFSDTGTWWMSDGNTRPFLRSEYSTTIANAHQLQLMAMNLGATYTLVDNIDMSELSQPSGMWKTTTGFVPIGTSSTPFTGTFNGIGHTITGLYINRSTTDYIGLFGYNTGVIRNVGLTGVNITGQNYVGGLAGWNNSGGIITNSYSSSETVSGSSFNVGGLVGLNYGIITNSYSSLGTVNGASDSVGGLVGFNFGSISNSYSKGSVNGINNVGGLVGWSDGSISNSYSMGTVSGTGNYVGGLVGYHNGGTIRNSYSTGAVSGEINVGGLVGYAAGGTVTSSYWDTQTSGQGSSAGGTGLSTADMMKMSSFSGWDIVDTGGTTAVWRIYEDNTYPLLRSFLTPLSVTANSDSKTYNKIAYTGGNGVVYSSVVNGETFSELGGSLVYSGTSQGAVNAGSYSITPGGYYSNQQGYDISFVDGALAVNKAALTITAQTNTKTYDATTSAAAVPVVTGLLRSDTVTGASETYDNKNAGTNKTVSVSAYTVNDGNSGGNYTVSTVDDTTGVINKAALTITAQTNTKTYDATTSAATIPITTGLLGSDTVIGASETYDNKNAGTGKILSVAAYTVNDGNSGGNYTVSTVDDTTGVINKAALTIVAQTNTKTYDTTTSAVAVPVAMGILGSDTVTGASETYDNKNAGTGKTVSVAAYTVNDGNSGGNYTVATVDDIAGVINKADLTVHGLTASNKTYDASTAATLSGTAAVAPLTGDVVTIGGTASGTFANKNAGTGKAVTVTGNTISGTDAGNYNLLQQTGLTADISKAALTIMATTNTKTYDGTTAAAALPAITSGSIMSGDSITLAESYTDKNAGSSKMLTPTVTISDGNGGNNYSTNFINDITGVINKASLTITADNNSRIYGDANPVLTGSISGFVNGETLATSGVTGGADYTTLASASSNVGTYNINPNAGTLASGNYSIGSLVNGTLTINKAALSIIADDKTKYSGDFNPLLTATYSGFKLGQNESVLDGTLSLTTTSVQSSPVGDYPIIPSGVTSNNYQISFVNGDLKVIPVYIPQQNALYVTVPDFNGTTTTFIVADDGNGGSLGSDTGDNSQSQKDGQDNGIKTQALPYCN